MRLLQHREGEQFLTLLIARWNFCKASAQKKARRPFGCGRNPIQGELEETGRIILRRSKDVCFIVVMTGIHRVNILCKK